MSKKLFAVLGLLVIFSMLLVACGGNEAPVNEPVNEPTTNEPADDTTDEPMEEPEAPARMGGYLDTIRLERLQPGRELSLHQVEGKAPYVFLGTELIVGFTDIGCDILHHMSCSSYSNLILVPTLEKVCQSDSSSMLVIKWLAKDQNTGK